MKHMGSLPTAFSLKKKRKEKKRKEKKKRKIFFLPF